MQFDYKICRHSWSSSYGVAIFHYRLRSDEDGEVQMELMGQKCKMCVNPKYETPVWGEQGISIAVSSLLAKVKEKCYGIKLHSKPRDCCIIEENKKRPHLSHLCQACERKVCVANRQDIAVNIKSFELEMSNNQIYYVKKIVFKVIVPIFFILFSGWKSGIIDSVMIWYKG